MSEEKAKSNGSFFKNIKAEFKRCTWPKKDDLIKQSALVIVVSIVLGAVIAGIDWIIRLGIDKVLGV
ncbi:preprotein translocase subunit SecE [Eubacterium xylanophilum]|uniref:preprotein translocase subunit SecE n=1 Tax=Eubacterium xylanophilum TaxID=39497 RepID=UPI0004792EB5|nr:preprotein translocase subunit SecE [Eubacterium xylanophilum]MCR5798171.1 preprotein translocase subunit SecE [Eubacterium sp.]